MNIQDMWHIGMYACAVFAVLAVMLGLPAILGERHGKKKERQGDIATGVPYESGIRPTGTPQTRLPIQYYLVAMLFVIFDVEAVYVYAWAVAVPETGWLGFAEAAIFIVIVLAALAYLWRIGALDSSVHYQQPQVRRPHSLKDKEGRDALVA